MVRRILLVLLVAVTGCATCEPVTVAAGSSVCLGSNGSCEKLQRTAESLNTPEMSARIREAQRGR